MLSESWMSWKKSAQNKDVCLLLKSVTLLTLLMIMFLTGYIVSEQFLMTKFSSSIKHGNWHDIQH